MAEEIKKERKKRSLSLIQPTSVPTLGNYLGAMRGWKDFQDDFDTVFGIADLHSITVRQDPQKLRTQTTQLYALLMATGLDPDKSILFIQSHVPQHSQLAWILNCYTQFGELNRMTQFKDKSAKHADNATLGQRQTDFSTRYCESSNDMFSPDSKTVHETYPLLLHKIKSKYPPANIHSIPAQNSGREWDFLW